MIGDDFMTEMFAGKKLRVFAKVLSTPVNYVNFCESLCLAAVCIRF